MPTFFTGGTRFVADRQHRREQSLKRVSASGEVGDVKWKLMRPGGEGRKLAERDEFTGGVCAIISRSGRTNLGS